MTKLECGADSGGFKIYPKNSLIVFPSKVKLNSLPLRGCAGLSDSLLTNRIQK